MPANSSTAAQAVAPCYARRVRTAVCSAPTATRHARPSSRTRVRADTWTARILEGSWTSEHSYFVLPAWCCSSCWCSQAVVRHRLPEASPLPVPPESRSPRRRLLCLPTCTDRMNSKLSLIKRAVCNGAFCLPRQDEGCAVLGLGG